VDRHVELAAVVAFIATTRTGLAATLVWFLVGRIGAVSINLFTFSIRSWASPLRMLLGEQIGVLDVVVLSLPGHSGGAAVEEA
jgi:hypothetical protein